MSQMNDENLKLDEPWLTQAKRELSEPLAPSVAGQLRAARRTAIEQAGQQPTSVSSFKNIIQWGMPALAGIMAIVLTINLLPPSNGPDLSGAVIPLQATGSIASEDLAIIEAPDDLEFYQNLELLLWMEQIGNDSSQG